MLKNLLLFLIVGFTFTTISCKKKNKTEIKQDTTIKNADHDSLFFILSAEKVLPSIVRGNKVNHTFLTLSYVEEFEVAEWVAYSLNKSKLKSIVERKKNFTIDPDIETESATPDDYTRSGYDRGHLAPSADMKFSDIAMNECFYMSNISPQHPDLNRGIWKDLEEEIREWVFDGEKDSLYIFTGPIYDSLSTKKIGKNKILVPSYFYKIILDYSSSNLQSISFIFPNKDCNLSIENYSTSIDEIEKRTSIDFLSILPDNIEESLEKARDIKHWSFD